MSQKRINERLSKIVSQEATLEAVVVVDLINSYVMYLNNNLKDINPDLYYQLTENFGLSEACANFSKLAYIPFVLNNFGTSTNSGKFEYFLGKLAQKCLVGYLTYCESLPTLICYISPASNSLNSLITATEKRIGEIIDELNAPSP